MYKLNFLFLVGGGKICSSEVPYRPVLRIRNYLFWIRVWILIQNSVISGKKGAGPAEHKNNKKNNTFHH